jgi:diguanylate cyclase (GGDEF)-like protein
MRVLSCIATEHNLRLVLLAAIVCVIGCLVSVRLLERARRTEGVQRFGWVLQTAVVAGSSVWCTHFVAMLAYDPAAPVTFDPILTMTSLTIAIVGVGIGFGLAAAKPDRDMTTLAGAIVGTSISAMHYVGMAAYHISGIVTWNTTYVGASVICSAVLAIIALHFTTQIDKARSQHAAILFFTLAIVSLHFTGMAAVTVAPLSASVTNDLVLHSMAVAVAGVSLFIVCTGVASHMTDARSRNENSQRLQHMALTDALTGLANRRGFAAHLDSELARAQNSAGRLAVIMIDLNRFREINDLRGHQAGDQALKIAAGRIEQCLGTGGFAARVGGDDFGIIKQIRAHSDLLMFLQQLETALFEPIQIGDFTNEAGAHMGVTVFPEDGTTQEALIGNANLAMHRAKVDPSAVVCFYESKLDDAVRQRRLLARELDHAIELNQLELYFQVQVSVPQSTICGYEVLLRWKHPQRGLVPPLDFIPLAEENGSIIAIGEWVIREACRRAAAWTIPHRVAVNLSPVQFGQPDLPRRVHQILIETGLPPSRLELEITESAIINDKVRALHTLRQIKALGVTISLDDFGTGYSSFETLRTYPFDKIKLDRLFMTEVESSPQSLAVMRAVLTLGKSLGVPILAEGVENQSQLDILLSEGCDEAQGYLLGRPKPHQEVFRADGMPLDQPVMRPAPPPLIERIVA